MDKGLTVLIMDDADIVRSLLGAMLMDLPNVGRVLQAPDAASALRLAAEYQPDIAILDISVPGDGAVRDGIGVLRWLKQRYPHTQVLMLSNHASRPYRSESSQAGADGFFDKSGDFEALLEWIEQQDGQLEAAR
jgi:DNA-binding NarL/FixJ family response regulator